MAPPRPTNERVLLSHHAVERFQERLRPRLTYPDARRELEQLLERGEMTATSGGGHFLLVGSELALPLMRHSGKNHRWVAMTCLTRGELPPGPRFSRAAGSGPRPRR